MAEHDESIVVRFVKILENSSDLMQSAFNSLSEVGAKGVWFSADDCFSVTKRDKRIFYVFDSFSGQFFEHIASTGSRIYGPSCILQCLKNGETLPRLACPVFSKSMQGLVVSCTNLSGQLRDEVHQRVSWMMGEVSKDFHERVTHLVVGEVGSKKYTVAVSLKKKIMSVEWVSAVWQRSHSELVRADDPAFDQLHCPPFKGFVICVSGFDTEERTKMKNLVENAGGKYSGEMKINECTHLVVSVAKGQKYEFAVKWKINIVSPKWIYDCVCSNYCLQERLYAVEKTKSKADDHRQGLTSTPTGESLDTANTSILSNMSAVSMTTINDTALLRRPSSMTQGHPTAEGKGCTGESAAVSKGRSKDSDLEFLNSINLTNARAGFFLDGCKIFICGIPPLHLERVRRIINLGGGTRFNQINESVSHVVMGETDDETIQRLLQASFRPKVVSVRWLADCFHRGQRLSEDEYRCVDVPELTLSASPSEKRIQEKYSRKGSNETKASIMPPVKSKSDGVNTTLTANDCNDDMHDVLSQYMPSRTSGFSLGESTLMRAAGENYAENNGHVSKDGRSKNAGQDDETTMYVEPNVDNGDRETADDGDENDPTNDGLIFAGTQFLIFGFDTEEVEMISNLITEHGGTVLPPTTRCVPDYGVVPLYGCPVRATVGEVVTNAWLQMCIENERLLAVEDSVIFSPVSLVPNARPLLGCILSISGYCGVERDVLLEISNALGGTCQDYFLRKAKANLLASTHLIVQSAEGSKYLAAKKWNVPAVNKMWLIECARTGRRVDVGDFLIDNHPDESRIGNNRLTITDAVEQPPSTNTNKRRSQCPSIVPAKRSRGEVQWSKDNVPPTEHAKENVDMNRELSSDVFKQPTLPPVALSTPAAAGVESEIQSVLHSAKTSSSSLDNSTSVPLVRENRLARNKNSARNSKGGDRKSENSRSDCSSAVSPPSVRVERSTKREKTKETVDDGDGSSVAKQHSLVNEDFVEPNSHPPVVSNKPQIVDSDPRTVDQRSLKAQQNSEPVRDRSFSALDEFFSAKIAKKTNSDIQKSGATPEKHLTKEFSSAAAAVKHDVYKEKPKNGRLEELIQDERHAPVMAPADAKPWDTPIGETYHMKLDLNGVLSPWASPMEVARRPSRVSLPLEELFAESIGIAIKNCESRSKRDDSFSQKANNDSFGVDVGTVSGPLKGVIIAVAKKLSKNQTEYNSIAASLGAEYRWTYDNGCTHFIFQGRLNDTNKEFRLARDQGKFVVSPHWLSACEEQSCRMDETNYPHTYNPSLSLSIMGPKTPGRKVTSLKTPARLTRALNRADSDSNRTAEESLATRNDAGLTKSSAVDSDVAPAASNGVALNPVANVRSSVATEVVQRVATAVDDIAAAPVLEPSNDISDAGAASVFAEKMESDVFETTDATLSDEELANACENLENQGRSSTRELTLLNGLKRLNEASRNHGRGKPLTRYLSSEKDSLNCSSSKLNRSVTEGKEEIEEAKPAATTAKPTAAAKSTLAPKTLSELNTQPSQFVEVVWDDPGAREQRKMLASDLEKNSESPEQEHEHRTSSATSTAEPEKVSVICDVEPVCSTKPGSVSSSRKDANQPVKPSASESLKKASPLGVQNSSDENLGKKVEKIIISDQPLTSKSEVAGKRGESKPVFIFSGLSPEERDQFTHVIDKLGGNALDTTNYANECTHLIIEKPTRNEKFLACVATGKWILHKSYLEDCVKANEFISEESYEWGAKAMASIWNSLPPQAVKLAEAAVRWRQRLSKLGKKVSGPRGAFETWRVLLLTESRREDGFQRLLEAGGATVLSNKLPLNFSKATHAFIDLAKLKIQVDLEGMVRSGVSCLKPEYIASYLTDDPPPEPIQFFISEASKFLR